MEHEESNLFARFNIDFIEDGLDNEIEALTTPEDCMFGEYNFEYFIGRGMAFAGHNPDRIAPGRGAETILICNGDHIRGVYNDAGSYRTYGQSITFAGIINADGGDRNELLVSIIDDLAGYGGYLTGNVVESGSGNPIENATLIFQDCGLTLHSDEDGYFEFDRFPREEFMVIVEAEGYGLTMRQFSFEGEESIEILVELQPLDVRDDKDNIVHSFGINGAYPNPFNSTTSVEISVDIRSNVTFSIHDLSGKVMKNLHSMDLNPGNYTVPVSLSDLPTGMYLVNMSDGERRSLKKVTLLR